MSQLEDVAERDGWRCWICDETGRPEDVGQRRARPERRQPDGQIRGSEGEEGGPRFRPVASGSRIAVATP
jgi:hypothetical protein